MRVRSLYNTEFTINFVHFHHHQLSENGTISALVGLSTETSFIPKLWGARIFSDFSRAIIEEEKKPFVRRSYSCFESLLAMSHLVSKLKRR